MRTLRSSAHETSCVSLSGFQETWVIPSVCPLRSASLDCMGGGGRDSRIRKRVETRPSWHHDRIQTNFPRMEYMHIVLSAAPEAKRDPEAFQSRVVTYASGIVRSVAVRHAWIDHAANRECPRTFPWCTGLRTPFLMTCVAKYFLASARYSAPSTPAAMVARMWENETNSVNRTAKVFRAKHKHTGSGLVLTFGLSALRAKLLRASGGPVDSPTHTHQGS